MSDRIRAKQKLHHTSLEWAKKLDYNRNHDEWNDYRIEHTQWQDNSGGFNDTVPLDELVLYLAIKCLECELKEFYSIFPISIDEEFRELLIEKVYELLAGKGYYTTKEKPDSFRVMGLESTIADAMKPVDDLNNNPFPNISDDEQKKHVEIGIRHYLGQYADSFPFGTNYEVRTYKEAKLIYSEISTIKEALVTSNISKRELIKKSTNNSRGYKATTVTELKKNIKEMLHKKLNLSTLNKDRKNRIISRMTELILR